MDRQDAKPSRPSLLAGAQTSAVADPSSARILTDLQDRPAGAGNAAGNASLRRGAMLALALLAIGLVTWWWPAGPGPYGEPANATSRLGGAPDVAPGHEAVAVGAATIVEEGTRTPQTPPVDGPRAGPDPETSAVVDLRGRAAGDAADERTRPSAANPFVVAGAEPHVAATRPKQRQRPSAPRGTATPASSDEPDLLAILMGNIKPDQDVAAGDGSGLEAFIRTMEAEDTGMASVEENRNGRPRRARSQQIQQNLRECPAANTAKGLKCRQEICAVYAGRDPACPANG